MKFIWHVLAALTVLLTAENATAQTSYPEQARANSGRLHSRHGAGRVGAAARRQIFGKLGRAGRRSRTSPAPAATSPPTAWRKPPRTATPCRWAEILAGHQSEPLREAALRSGKGLCADRAGLRCLEYSDHSPRCAGQDVAGTRRAGEGAARQADLRSCRHRHVAASRRRAVQIYGTSTLRRSPIAARPLWYRTCSAVALRCSSAMS